MADVKISALPLASTPLAGTEVLPIVQSATTDQVSVANLTAGRAVSAASLTLTTTPLAVGSGGTGLTSLTAGYIPYGNVTSAFASSSGFTFDGSTLTVSTGTTSTPFVIKSGVTSGIEIYSLSSDASSRNWATLINQLAYGDFGIYQSNALNGNPRLASTARLYIDSSGNVGIGTSSPSTYGKFAVVGNANSDLYVSYVAGTNAASLIQLDGPTAANTYYNAIISKANGTQNWYIGGHGSANTLAFDTGSTERARIDSTGALLVNTTSRNGYITSQGATNGNAVSAVLPASASGGSGYNSNTVTAADTGWYHFVGQSGNGSSITTNDIIIFGNGNIQNANNSYGSLSDISLKENIIDATPKLSDILKVKIRNFNFIADKTKTKQIGVIAQELEEIFPSMIEEDKDGIKGVKYSLFTPMLVKAIQELAAKVAELEAKI